MTTTLRLRDVAPAAQTLSLAQVDRVLVLGDELSDAPAASALIAAYAAATRDDMPRLEIAHLSTDDQRARAGALLRALPTLRQLTLRHGDDQAHLPDLADTPAAVERLTLRVIDGARLDLSRLAPSPHRWQLELQSDRGEVRLGPLAHDAHLVDFTLRGGATDAHVVSTWPALARLDLRGPHDPARFLLDTIAPIHTLHLSNMSTISLTALSRTPHLRRLELAGPKNSEAVLSALSAVPDLHALRLAAMAGVRRLDLLAEAAPGLSRVELSNLKRLESLDGLQALPKLREILLEGTFASALNTDALKRCPSLWAMTVGDLKPIGLAKRLHRLAMTRGLEAEGPR